VAGPWRSACLRVRLPDLGAACVIVGDMIEERLAQAESFGCETINLATHGNLAEQIEQILGVPEVDCAVDCVGFEARGHGADAATEKPAPCSTRSWKSPARPAASASPASTSPATPAAWTRTPRSAMLGIRIGLAGPRATPSHRPVPGDEVQRG